MVEKERERGGRVCATFATAFHSVVDDDVGGVGMRNGYKTLVGNCFVMLTGRREV